MRIREHIGSGDIFIEDTIPFDSFDIEAAVGVVEAELDTLVAEWPVLIEENNGVWQLIFVNPWPVQDDYLDFPELT